MNIGIVTTWFARGAAYVSRQFKQALEPEHKVFIYARGGEIRAQNDPLWDHERVTWAAQGIVPSAMSVDLDHFRSWIERNNLDVAFFNEQWWWDPVLLANRLGVKTGVYLVEYTEQTIPFFGCYDFLIANTRQHAGVFDWHPQMFYVPWGTDLETFRPRKPGFAEDGAVTFVTTGGMNPVRKGSDLAIRALRRVAGPVRLVVHSQIGLADCFPTLKETINELEQSGRLRVIEKTFEDPAEPYHFGDVYVYPSRFDGLGLSPAEALACGLPVIATDNPPMNEFVTHENGRLVKVARLYARRDGVYWPQSLVDETSLVEAMQCYLDMGKEILTARKRAREYAEQHLDWRKNARELPRLFAESKRQESPAKASAIAETQAFELERARQSPRYWLSYHYPRAVRTARSLARMLR